MKALPAMLKESSAPGLTYVAPHILVLCKTAKPMNEQYTYFKTIKEQYDWYKSLVDQIGNVEKPVMEKAEELISVLHLRKRK
jgi:hypothetical protein